ncbi:MAG: anti-sigma factor [Sphingobacteriaceae bacterium]|nr:anti-sigma factor [Sphingobacteriaceae bacterium]
MENIKAYIESGVLELYVLGDLSTDEKLEVERVLETYPELKTEVEEIEKALQGFAEAEAVEPKEALRSKILDSMNTGAAENDIPVLPITKPNSSFYKYAFAASVALLLLSLFALINLRSQLKDSHNQIAVLQQSNQKFTSRVNYVEKQLDETRQSLNIFHNPEQYKVVNLKGTPNAPTASIMVAFNPAKSEVMIDLASIKMPANDPSHQYQLWALVDGKPVDLGVFNAGNDTTGVLKMKSLAKAQAFAVTLEPKGGSINPTMEQMMAMGAI